MIKHLSLFSGLGGASSALKQAKKDFETLAISEVDPRSLAVYKAIHGYTPYNEGNIIDFSNDAKRLRFYTTNEIPDLITGGFPCQPFSLLNLKKKEHLEDDERYQAALAMRKIVNIVQPKYVMLENVKSTTNKKYWPHVKAFLDGFTNYNWITDAANPIDYGYHQSRGRVYFLLSRKDQPIWFPGTMVKRKRKFKFSNEPNESEFFRIFPPRVKKEVDKTDPSFACLAARSCDAHCGRFTWIPDRGFHRSPTLNELFQLFGYAKKPKIALDKSLGLSRSAIYHAFGNSWHIGHAASHIATLPLE